MEEHEHVYVTAEVTEAPKAYQHEIGTLLTICAICGKIQGAEK